MKAKEFIPQSKPRNFVAKNQKTAGAGAHKDKKRDEKQGDIKHKGKQFEQGVAEGSAHGYNVAKWYEKWNDQGKLTKWLKKEAGLPKDAPVYFDDADLVYVDKTIVRDALVDPKLKFIDLLNAVAQASGGKTKQYLQGIYRENSVAEGGVLKSIERGLKGWQGSSHLADIQDYVRNASDKTLLFLYKNPGESPYKKTPRDIQIKLINRELKRRYGVKPGEQGVAEGDSPGMKDGRPYSDPLRRHPGNDSYMTPDYLIQKYQDELKKIAAGPYKRPKDVAMYQARIAKLQRQQGVAEVSKATIDRYVAKASDSHGDADFAARMSKHDPDKRSYHVDQKKTAEKRRQGISRALDRMSREESVEEARQSAQVKLAKAWDRQQAKSAASRERAKELLNPAKKDEKKDIKEAYAGDVTFKVGNWTYRAEEEDDGDVRKLFHDAVSPAGKSYPIDFSPYETMTPETFKLWIKMKMPKRQGRGPLGNKEILQMAQMQGIANLDPSMAKAGLK